MMHRQKHILSLLLLVSAVLAGYERSCASRDYMIHRKIRQLTICGRGLINRVQEVCYGAVHMGPTKRSIESGE